jgi:hypothetical protein
MKNMLLESSLSPGMVRIAQQVRISDAESWLVEVSIMRESAPLRRRTVASPTRIAIGALLKKEHLAFVGGQEIQNFMHVRRVALAEEFLNQAADVEPELVHPYRTAKRLFHRAVKQRKRQTELAGQKLEFGDLPRRTFDPPAAFEKGNRAVPAD